MTKRSHWMLTVMATMGVAWLGVACAPTSEPEPEATATVAAEPAPEVDTEPIWKQCLGEPDCITGARVEIKSDDSGNCVVSVQPWFPVDDGAIAVYSEGRVFFLLQWQQECEGKRVYLEHSGERPWSNDCRRGGWRRPHGKSFVSMSCEVQHHTEDKDFHFCLELDQNQECTSERTGGTVRVRGSGGGALPGAGSDSEEDSGR